MHKRRIVPFLVPALCLAVWEAAVRLSLLSHLFFPAPSELVSTLADMIVSGEMAQRLIYTLTRAGTGFAIGAALGILCGAAMGASTLIRRALDPFVSALYATPKLTLLPMLMLIVGPGEMARQVIIAATVFLVVVMNTVDGIRSIPPHLLEMAENYGASRSLLFRRVYLPASAPHVFTGLRLGIGRAVVIAISVELVVGGTGIGNLVWTAWLTFSPERIYVAVILSALLGLAVNQGLKGIEARMIPWKANKD
jgi:sulfonate transport system permease protein